MTWESIILKILELFWMSDLELQFFDATRKRQSIAVLWIFHSQYITGRHFWLPVTAIPKLEQYLRIVFIIYFWISFGVRITKYSNFGKKTIDVNLLHIKA